jgi:tetratricopeptide (TPR) repeat protein
MKLLNALTLLSLAVIPTLVVLGQRTDDAAIKQAIQEGWEASTAKNADGVKAVWMKDPHAVSTFIGRYNYNSTNSWDSIAASTDRNFKANPNPSRTSFTIRNHNIRTSGNMAFAEYEAIVTPVNGDPTSFPYIPDSIEFKTYQVLVKDNDQWKTVALINTDPKSFDGLNSDHAIESGINEIGYRYLNDKKFDKAIEVFKLNVKLYPNLWNTYDSLGEAYAAAGNKKLAIENYEKSLKLNPKSESGKVALVKLKQL